MEVFISGSIENKIDKKYLQEARNYSEFLAKKGYNLMFGARNDGILREIYEAFRNEDAYIKAITIDRFKEDLKKVSADEEIISANTYKQYRRFFEADIMVFMTGGVGTLSELSFMLNAKRNNETKAKIYLINMFGFYDNLITELSLMYKEEFIDRKNLFVVINNIDELKEELEEC